MLIDLLKDPVETLIYPAEPGLIREWKIPDNNDYLRTIRVKRLENGRLSYNFRYNEYLKDQVKTSLGDCRWDPKTKSWHSKDNARTRFVWDYLAGGEFFDRYDCELQTVEYTRPETLREHQKMLVSHIVTRRRAFWMAEMGVGKTLASIEFMEWVKKNLKWSGLDKDNFWVVAPKNVLNSWRRELPKWSCLVKPRLVSVDSLKKEMDKAKKPPRSVIVDESSRVKNFQANRSQYAFALSDSMEMFWGPGTFFLTMTGTAQPKSLFDVYSQMEIPRPGFLVEKNDKFFKRRVGMIQTVDGPYGKYGKVLGMKDGTCSMCSLPKDKHSDSCTYTPRIECDHCEGYHTKIYGCSKLIIPKGVEEQNEVENLASRSDGLAVSLRKKDCLDLPEKVYIDLFADPTNEMLEAAELVMAQQATTIEVLNRLRQFSDGFLYDKETGLYTEMPENPKRKLLNGIFKELEDCEETRIIVYAGFRASLEIVKDICLANDFNVIMVDGNGWRSFRAHPCHLEASDAYFVEAPKDQKIAFVGHPDSCGLGLNLQIARYMVYWSNSYNGEGRLQSEDRAHRQGMRESLTIYDLMCLGTDVLVRDNLIAKRDAQNITMEEIKKFNRKRVR